MFGLELTFAQKIEIGVVVIVLALAGYFVYSGTRGSVDATITAWGPESRHVGIDPRRPVSPKNPADPSKTVQVTTFACHDGRVEITEYPADSGLRASFAFLPDLTLPKRGQSFTFYKDPAARYAALSDPFKRELSLAAYDAAIGRPGPLAGELSAVGLTKDQSASEKTLRESMMTQADLAQNGAQTGTFEPELYENVLRALAAYRAQQGDPTKNATKSALARKVIDRVMDYLGHLDKKETDAVDKYVDGISTLLDDSEKSKIVSAAPPPPPQKGPKTPRNPRVRPPQTPPPPPPPVP